IALTGSVDPGVDPVWMAPDKISRVLRNLLENALRYTPPGGQVQLRADVRDGQVMVTVKDSGEGIALDDLPRIFDRFYRGDTARARSRVGEEQSSGGAGLGLAIAKGLVEAHHGQIWAESTPGRGTLMKFVLPKTWPNESQAAI
ncbi:MAG: sensor histidine kinase, partial [Anaerolineales bacterium]